MLPSKIGDRFPLLLKMLRYPDSSRRDRRQPYIRFKKGRVKTAFGDQLGVGAGFDDAARIHDANAIGIDDRLQSMRDDNGRAAATQVIEGFLNLAFGFGIERRG